MFSSHLGIPRTRTRNKPLQNGSPKEQLRYIRMEGSCVGGTDDMRLVPKSVFGWFYSTILTVFIIYIPVGEIFAFRVLL